MAQQDFFMKIGDIKGESVDSKHKDEIDVHHWNWGMQNSGSMHVGGGGGSGKVKVDDLSFTKPIDKASPALLLACCSGKHYDKAVLVVRKAGDTPLEYLTITMEEVIISGLSVNGTGDEKLSETVHLNFSTVKMEYKTQAKDGSAGPTATGGWNVAENVKI
jgi:type VI secretion system secreted protein Hcp